MLSQLREATTASHQALDSAFGSLNLSERDDQVRFLAAHAIGIDAVFPVFRHFVENDLGLPCPDYPAMLSDDLKSLGMDETLPRIAPPEAPVDAGLAYVVAGSRLGLAVIRKGGYWGRTNGQPSAYMEDEAGQDIWKALLVWLRERDFADDTIQGACKAALGTFSTFGQAFRRIAALSAAQA